MIRLSESPCSRIDGIAMDSLDHIYTGEVDDGKRLQKFVLVNGDGVRRPRPHD